MARSLGRSRDVTAARRPRFAPCDGVERVAAAQALQLGFRVRRDRQPHRPRGDGRDRRRDQDLPGAGGRPDARGDDDGPAVEVVARPDRRPVVDPHPHPQRLPEARVRGRQATLQRDRAADGGGRTGERDHEPVAHRLDDGAAVPRHDAAHERVVALQDLEPRVVAEALEVLGRADDVREQERDRGPRRRGGGGRRDGGGRRHRADWSSGTARTLGARAEEPLDLRLKPAGRGALTGGPAHRSRGDRPAAGGRERGPAPRRAAGEWRVSRG
jgi:hypothetical protein